MSRYFVAIPIPRELRQRLSFLRANLPDARWIAEEDYHLTLRFLGDCDGPTLTNLVSALDQIDETPFKVQPSTLETFGHDRPRMIWLGIADNPSVTRLHQRVDAAARRVGLELDGRKFTPHITLARLSRTKPAQVAKALEDLGTPELPPFDVENFALYASGRSRGGGPYAIEETFQLHSSETGESKV